MRALLTFLLLVIGASVASAQPLPEAAEGRTCDAPILWVAEYGIDGFAQPYCDGCLPGRGESCAVEVRKRGDQLLLEPEENIREGETRVHFGACQLAEYRLQLIRAWHGRPVQKSWRAFLDSRHDWVGKRPRASYPRNALPILKQLKQTRKQCTRLQAKYAKFLTPAKRFIRSKKTAHPIPTVLDSSDWGPGLSDRLVWQGSTPLSGVALTIYEEPATLGAWYNEDADPEPDKQMKEDRFTPGLSEEWRGRKYAAIVFVGEEGGGFRCWGECEGGWSLDILLNDQGEIVGQQAGFSACPFVYTAPAGTEAFVMQGEILRNLRRPGLETGQTLAIVGERQACEAGALRVRLTEEKREVTYLDDVSLLIGDNELKPVSCGDATNPFCSDDGVYATLEENQFIDLEFEIGEGLREACDDLALRADGYYVPLTE